MKSNKGLRPCAYGMPSQIFYALDLSEPKVEAKLKQRDQLELLCQFWKEGVLSLELRLNCNI